MNNKFTIDNFKKRFNLYKYHKEDSETILYKLAAKHSILPYFTEKTDDKFGKKLYLEHIKESMKMSSELIRLIKLFHKEGLSPVPFKGAVLSLLSYGSITKRQYSDIDIYINEEERDRALKILYNHGYKESMQIPKEYKTLWYKKSKDISLKNSNLGVTVELHWRLLDSDFPVNIDKEIVENNLTSVNLSNYNIKTFSPELYLLYLSIHGTKHFWDRIGWIRDIDRLIRVNRCDIKKAISLTDDKSARDMIALTLYLSTRIFGTPLPDEFISSVNSNKLTKFEQFVYKNWQSEQSQFKKCCIMVSYLSTLSQKLSYINYTLFKPTPNEFKLIKLPPSLIWLHYIIRIIRLSIKYTILKIEFNLPKK